MEDPMKAAFQTVTFAALTCLLAMGLAACDKKPEPAAKPKPHLVEQPTTRAGQMVKKAKDVQKIMDKRTGDLDRDISKNK